MAKTFGSHNRNDNVGTLNHYVHNEDRPNTQTDNALGTLNQIILNFSEDNQMIGIFGSGYFGSGALNTGRLFVYADHTGNPILDTSDVNLIAGNVPFYFELLVQRSSDGNQLVSGHCSVHQDLLFPAIIINERFSFAGNGFSLFLATAGNQANAVIVSTFRIWE